MNKLIKVKVYPDSKKEEIIKKDDLSFIFKIKEPAKNNQANKKTLEILSRIFNKNIRLIKGKNQKNKIFSVDN